MRQNVTVCLALAGLCLIFAPAARAQIAAGQAAGPAADPAAAAAPAEECNSICRVFRTLSPPAAAAPEPAVQTTASTPAPRLRRASARGPYVRAAHSRDRAAPRRGALRFTAEAPAPGSGAVRIGLLSDAGGGQQGMIADLAAALAPDFAVEARTGKRPIMEDLLAMPSVDAAIVSGPALAEAKRSAEKLVVVAKLFTQELHAVARSDIRTLADLAGKPVYLGPAGSDGAGVAKAFLQSRRISVEPVGGSFEAALAGVRQGRVAALLVLAPKPFAPLAQIPESAGLRLVPLSPRADDPAFYPSAFADAVYPGLAGGEERVDTVAVDAVLVAPRWRESSPRQTELGRFVRGLFNKLPALADAARHPKWRETNVAAPVGGWHRLRVAEDWVNAKLKDARVGTAPGRRQVGEMR